MRWEKGAFLGPATAPTGWLATGRSQTDHPHAAHDREDRRRRLVRRQLERVLFGRLRYAGSYSAPAPAAAPVATTSGSTAHLRRGSASWRTPLTWCSSARSRGPDDYARRRLQELERRWSRFRPDSEVSRLNGSPEALLVVSEDTVRLVTTMLEAWRVTDGRYDPTLLAAIDAAGYTVERGRVRAAERRRARHAAPAHRRRRPRACRRRRSWPSPPAPASTPAASARVSPPTSW